MTETAEQTILPPDAWSVTWHPEEGWSLLMPSNLPPKDALPKEVLALTAAFMQLTLEPTFQEDMAAWMAKQAAD